MNYDKDYWAPFTGAVSLTFDDGTENQLQKAVPLLGQYDLKATFYVQPNGNNWQEKYSLWKKVAESGHEICNHTIEHLCSKNYSDKGF